MAYWYKDYSSCKRVWLLLFRAVALVYKFDEREKKTAYRVGYMLSQHEPAELQRLLTATNVMHLQQFWHLQLLLPVTVMDFPPIEGGVPEVAEDPEQLCAPVHELDPVMVMEVSPPQE